MIGDLKLDSDSPVESPLGNDHCWVVQYHTRNHERDNIRVKRDTNDLCHPLQVDTDDEEGKSPAPHFKFVFNDKMDCVLTHSEWQKCVEAMAVYPKIQIDLARLINDKENYGKQLYSEATTNLTNATFLKVHKLMSTRSNTMEIGRAHV